MSNNKDDSGYQWFSATLLESVFEKEFNCSRTDFNIKIISVKPAVAQGENYLSEVTRVQVEITQTNVALPKMYNLIVKSSISQMAELDDLHVFDNEMEYYNNVAPNIAKIDRTLHVSPKCYFADEIAKKQIIILDDISAQGYRMADRLVGLDLEHCKIYFTKIAAFHAITATYYTQNKLAKCFEHSNYSEDKRAFHKKWTDLSFQIFLGIFQEYKSLNQYADIVKTWDNNALFNTAQELTRPNPNGFNVLNHADSWINNILFRYDEHNNPIDIRLIDFQITNYGSPLLDIFSFFMTSPNLEVRETHFDELVQVYYDNLVSHLKQYRYTKAILTLNELHVEIVKKGFLASSFLVGYVPIVLVDPKDAVPFDKLMEDSVDGEKLRHNFYHNPRFIKLLEVVMKFLHNRGFLNIN